VADIFREVDEELQQERAAHLWKKYGGWVIAVAVAVVLGVTGNVLWTQYAEQQKAEQAAQLDAALTPLQDEQPAAAAEALDAFAGEASTGYAMLGRFHEAGAQARAGDVEAAVATYRAIAGMDDLDEVYRQLAVLKSVRLRVGSGDPAALSEELAPLTEDSSPWRPLALETEAAIALAAGDAETARGILTDLVADNAAPTRLRQRATELLEAIGN